MVQVSELAAGPDRLPDRGVDAVHAVGNGNGPAGVGARDTSNNGAILVIHECEECQQ
jgi:hypothetical protein